MTKLEFAVIAFPLLVLFISCGSPTQNTEHAEDGHQHEGEGVPQEEADNPVPPSEDQANAPSNLIQVPEDWEALIGLETAPAQIMNIDKTLPVPGEVVPNENRIAIISSFVEASVNSVLVNMGDYVKKGDILICLISPQIGILRAEHEKAKAELALRNQNLERRRTLYEKDVISERSFQEAQLEKQLAEASYKYSLKKLRSLGIEAEEIEHPPNGHADATGSTVHIHAPISGTITQRNANVGQKVDLATKLFEIINLETVWLDADIFERDLVHIKMGQELSVRVSAYPDEVFTGRIFYIGDIISPDTRTLCLRAQIQNRSRKMKPGMFAETSIVIGKKTDALVIPIEAVLEDENQKVVFVVEEGGYHRHVVTTGIETDIYVEITSGLHPDSAVVTSGHYQLLSRTDANAIDPHAGHVH